MNWYLLLLLLTALTCNAQVPYRGFAQGIAGTALYQSWSEVAGLPAARLNVSVVVYSNKLFAIGGNTTGGSRTNVYTFNGSSWTTEALGLPDVSDAADACVLSNKIYVYKGYSTSTAWTNAYVYSDGVWSLDIALPTIRTRAGLETINGKLYLIGGFLSSGQSTVYERSPDAGWASSTNLPEVKDYASYVTFTYNNSLYVAGGTAGGGTGITNIFSRSTGSWSKLTFPYTGMTYSTPATIHGDEMWAFNTTGGTNAIMVYNFLSSQWRLEPIPVAMTNVNYFDRMSAISYNGSLYLLGGGRTNVWRYGLGGAPP